MLSLIVPIYNSALFLRECLDSIIGQTYKDIDILLIDDGSTDSSGDICDEYEKKDKRIRVFHNVNDGLLETRLFGVEHAEGDIIGFVDSDDVIDKDMFYFLYNQYHEYKCDLITSAIICEYEDGRTQILRDQYDEGIYSELEKQVYPSMLFDFNAQTFGLLCNLVNKLFKREMLRDVLKSIDTRITFGEDAAVLYKYCLNAKNILITHRAFYHYKIRSGSMCLNKDEKILLNTNYLYTSLKTSFEGQNCEYSLMRQLRRYIMNIE